MPSTTYLEAFNARAEAYGAKIAETFAVTGRAAPSEALCARLARWMAGWATEEIALRASVADDNDWDLRSALASYKAALDVVPASLSKAA